MIEAVRGDVLRADVEAMVNPVNCIGHMGKGLALQFKRAFPANFNAYAIACKAGKVTPGTMFIHDTAGLVNPRYIINFPTKRHWREQSLLEDIGTGLDALVACVRQQRIRTIAIPPLGCGLGGLDWAVVRPIIDDAFAELPAVRVLLFEPHSADGR